MPRPSKSIQGRVLDYFRHAEAGEAKVVFNLASDIVKERFAALKTVKAPRKSKKAAAAASAQPNTTEAQQ